MRDRLLLSLLLALPVSAGAQAVKPHIGYIGSTAAASDAARTDAFKRGLRELGYVEGRNILVEWRYPEAGATSLPSLVSDLVQRNVQLIVVAGATATQAVKAQARSTAIVMTNVSDPVELGLVESLGRPGGNITGLTNVSVELNAKRLELLREIVPGLAAIAVMGDPGSPAYRPQAREVEHAAQTQGVKVSFFEVRRAEDLEDAFKNLSRAKVQAILTLQNPTLTRIRARIAELAVAARLPVMYPQREYVDAGGLISYGPDIPDLHRQAAYFVDKILKGAKPADLPVEQPRKFELFVNTAAAKKIGLAVPTHVLLRADQTLN